MATDRKVTVKLSILPTDVGAARTAMRQLTSDLKAEQDAVQKMLAGMGGAGRAQAERSRLQGLFAGLGRQGGGLTQGNEELTAAGARPMGGPLPQILRAQQDSAGRLQAQDRELLKVQELLGNQEKLAAIVRGEVAVDEARAKLAAAMAQEYAKIPPLATAAKTGEERHLDALRAVNLGLESQRDSVARLNAALDPARLRERLALEQQEAEAQGKIALARAQERAQPEAVGQEAALALDIAEAERQRADLLRQQPALVTAATTAEERRLAATRGVNEGLEGQRQRLADLRGAQEPGALRQRVGLQLQTEAEQKRLSKAESAERERQQPSSLWEKISKALNVGLPQTGQQTGALLGSVVGGGAGGVRGAAGAGIGNLLGGALGGSEALGAAAGPIGLVAVGLTALGTAASAVKDSIVSLTQTLVGLAGVAAPGVVRLYTRAWEDLEGVLGQRAVPVVRLFTDGVRFFGDVLNTLLPSQQQVTQALVPLQQAWVDLKQELTPIILELGPAIRSGLIFHLQGLAGAARLLVLALKPAIWGLEAMVKPLGLLFGKDDKLSPSFNAAFRAPQFTDARGLSHDLIKAGLAAGTKTKEEKPTDYFKDIREGVKRIVYVLEHPAEFAVKQVGSALEKTLPGGGIAAEVGRRAGEAIRGLPFPHLG